jgi:hypothetical protein
MAFFLFDIISKLFVKKTFEAFLCGLWFLLKKGAFFEYET